jgi:hypothetical protein
MKLKAITSASAILWGAVMLIVGLINWGTAAYGSEFLRTISSLYPGYHATRDFGQVILGTLYGIGDGALMGVFFGLLYRWTGGSTQTAASAVPEAPGAMPFRKAS